jgi:hypothetical protein
LAVARRGRSRLQRRRGSAPKQEYDARLAECNRLAELYKQADKASKGATAEFASTARGNVG